MAAVWTPQNMVGASSAATVRDLRAAPAQHAVPEKPWRRARGSRRGAVRAVRGAHRVMVTMWRR